MTIEIILLSIKSIATMGCRQNRKNLAANPARAQAELTQIARGSTHSAPLNSNDYVLQCSRPYVGETLRSSRRWGIRTALDDWVGLGCLSAGNLLANGKLWVRLPQPAATAYDKIQFANEGTTRADGNADVDVAAESSRVTIARLSSVACVFSLALDAKRQSEISQWKH